MEGYKHCLDVLSKLCPDWTPIETPTYEPELFSWIFENENYILFLTDEKNQVLHLRGSSRLGTEGMLAFLASNVRTSANKPIVVSCTIDARTQDHYHATWVVSLVYQLLCRIPWAYAHVRRFTDAFMDDSIRSSNIILRSAWTIFRALLATPNRREIIIIVDAESADLAADALLRENVWKLEELTDRDLSWRMIVARQEYPPGSALRELALVKLNMDTVKAVDEKVEAFIKIAASQLVQSSLYRDFENEVYQALHGQKPTLVTVDLKVQFLSGLRMHCTPASIREELNELAHCDLMGVYGRIMDTILERDRDWSKKVISWLLFAIRSMTPDELAVALSVNQDTTTCASAEKNAAVNMLSDLLRVFSSLVRTDNGVICEVHPSFRAFIISSYGKWYSFDGPLIEAQHASHTLTCLIYLCADDVFDSAIEMSPAQRGFRNYAARYWSEHYRYSIHTTEEVSHNLRAQVQLFFESKRRNLRKWCSLKRHLEDPQSAHERCRCTRVDLAAELGLADVVVRLLKDIADREAPFDDGASISSRASFGDVKKTRALKIAAENGNSKAVEAILKFAVRDGVIGSVNIGLALNDAARSGYDEIVRILLSAAKGNQFPETAGFLRTALVEAAGQGYQLVVTQLLEANAEVNLPSAVGKGKEDNGEEGEEPNGEGEDLTPLHIASQNGHDDIVEQLLAVGAKVSGFPERRATPLHMAAQHGQLMSVEKFLKTNAELNARDSTGSTAIHLACSNGFPAVVEALLDATSSAIGKDDRGRTLLHLAAAEGHDDIVEMLLKPSKWNVGVINSLDYRAETPLHLAASGGHMAVVEKFFSSEDSNNAAETAMSTANSDGDTPFHFAAKEGHLNVVDILLDNAADPEAQNSASERPLHLAARNGHRDVVARLLEVDCYPHVTTESGYTALHLAAEHGDIGVVEELLDATVSQDAELKDGTIALHLASQNGHTDVVKRLLDEGSSEDAVTESGATPLHFASENGHVDVVCTLIAAGAPLDDERNDECTALHLASENSHSNVVDVLIKAGANINSRNNVGWTPLHAAYGAKSAELLIAAGADVNALTYERDTPLFLFAASGDTESMQLLYDSGAELRLHETTDDGTDECLAHSAEVVAAEFGHLGALKLLIQWGVDPFEGDNCKPIKCTPLSKALAAGSNEVIEFLLQHVVDHPERLSEVMFTLIFHCALSDLLHLGETVNLNQKDEHGRTPLFYAAAGGDENIVRLLLSAGLETNLPDKEGRVALDVAMKPRIRQLLLEGPNIGVDDDANQPTDDEALAAICSCGYLISGDPGNLYRWSTLECLACGKDFVGFHYRKSTLNIR
jgi:ankyrin repeat protein